MIILHDLVPNQSGGQPWFSPATIVARLALLTKRVPFETRDVRYNDLRFIYKEQLGVEKATAPFIQREDGSMLMDSFEIAKWLEEAYPAAPSIFRPEASLPIDASSPEHLEAVRESKDFGKLVKFSGLKRVFMPRFAPRFTEEDREYWTSDKRMGEGVFKAYCAYDPEKALEELKEEIKPLEALLSSTNLFFSSPTAPGFKDFLALGPHRMLRSVSSTLADDVWGHGELGNWLKRMEEYYGEGLQEVYDRDPA